MIKQEIHLENVFSRNLKCFKNRPLNVWVFIEESIRLHSKKTCIIDENKNYSYSQILELVNSLETLFLKYNFKLFRNKSVLRSVKNSNVTWKRQQ